MISWVSLLCLAGYGLSRVFTTGGIWRAAGFTLVALYSPISSFFYFRRAHDQDGAARCAKPRPAVDDVPTQHPILTPEQSAFWSRFQDASGETAEGPRFVDAFGDSPDTQTELADLVIAGDKRAAAALDRWYTDETRPRPGDLALILNGRGEPACVIRTTRVDVMPVTEVSAAFAFEEGEGDKTLDWWLDAHRALWRREAAREGFTYSDDLDVCCERFELAWAPSR